MKVTYIDYYPKGSLLHPVYKVWETELTEHCDTIKKCGECYYMFRGGYVLKSIEVEKIKRIEFADMVINVTYNRMDVYPFSAVYTKKDGTHYQNQGCKDFGGILRSIRQYKLI